MKKGLYEYNHIILYLLFLILWIVFSAYNCITAIIINNASFLEVIIYPIGIIMGIYVVRSKYGKQKKYKEVLEKGIKVPGEIIKP